MTAPAAYRMPARVWPGDEPPAPPWPAPEIPCREATEAEIPRGARTIRAVALAHGWTVRATFARGTYPSRPPKVCDSLALRLCRDERRAAGVWRDGKFGNAYLAELVAFPCCRRSVALRAGNATELRAWLVAP